MVDFNNERTIGTPRSDILTVLLLQRRNDVIDAIEAYKKVEYLGSQSEANVLRARLLSLFMEIQAALLNDLGEEEFGKLQEKVLSPKLEDSSEAFQTMDRWLYRKNITKIDTRKHYDTGDVEEENEAHDF